MRTGVIAKKLGMSAIYSKSGEMVPVTLLSIDDCQVIGSKQINGKHKLEVGAFDKLPNRTSKPLKGYFAKNKISPKQKIIEFEVSNAAVLQSGVELRASHFVEGQFIDVTGTSIGKGFAGVMKRHNFSGMRASHGVSISHRAHGSTGQCQDPGKVFKGKKMAGHMGASRVTKQNIRVVLVDEENNIVAVKGSVPGHKGSFLILRDAVKRALPAHAPFPCFVKKQGEEVNLGADESDQNIAVDDNQNQVNESEA